MRVPSARKGKREEDEPIGLVPYVPDSIYRMSKVEWT